MKTISLEGANGKRLCHVESRDDSSAHWEVDVPAGHTWVGIYGRFGYAGGYTAIHGIGLLMYKNE